MMLGIIGIFTFLALGWQFSQKRAARRFAGTRRLI